MYKDAGCLKCNKGQIVSYGRTAIDVTTWSICGCAYIKTKAYKDFCDNPKKYMKDKTALEFQEFKDKWWDNVGKLKSGNNAVDRSW